MPAKSFEFKLQDLNGDTGQFTGIASTYGNIDLGGDVIEPGAFTKTIAVSGSQRPLLWQHSAPIGTVNVSDTSQGLIVRGQLSMAVGLAKDAHALLKDGVLKGLSIGFETVKEKIIDGVRHLSEVKLWEVSLVVFPMNQMAMVTDVKSLEAKLGRTLSAATRQRLAVAALHARNASQHAQNAADVISALAGDSDDGDGEDDGDADDKAAQQAELLRAIRSFRNEVKAL